MTDKPPVDLDALGDAIVAFIEDDNPDKYETVPPIEPTDVLLHRAAAWRRQFVAGHGAGYDDDPTFRLIRDLAEALEKASKEQR